MAQKNFTINAATKAAFAAFCKENAYTGNQVLAGAFLAFAELKHEDRVQWFRKASEKFAESGYAAEIDDREAEQGKKKGYKRDAG